jgi:hypothetical protein
MKHTLPMGMAETVTYDASGILAMPQKMWPMITHMMHSVLALIRKE